MQDMWLDEELDEMQMAVIDELDYIDIDDDEPEIIEHLVIDDEISELMLLIVDEVEEVLMFLVLDENDEIE